MRKDILKAVERFKIMEIKINYSSVAKKYNCDPRTVKKYENGTTGKERKKVIKKSKLDDYKATIEEKVDICGATAMSIYEFIKTRGFTGKYCLVKKYVKSYKNEQIKKATIRFETNPGLQAQVDWKERKKMVNKKGEIFEINIFLFVLGYSRYKYLEITEDKKQDTLFKCLNNAFKKINGVPQEILFDNMSTVVDRNNSFLGEVSYNKRFEQFAKDNNFTPLACKPYRPQTKGKVEALAKLTNRLDVYNYEFTTFEELQEIVRKINEELNASHSQAINDIPKNRLKNEQKCLLALPSGELIESYTEKRKTYKVSKESMISFKGNKYSVPTFYIGKELEVSYLEDNRIQISYSGNVIAKHKISDKLLNYKLEHVKEILKTDAYKHKSDEEIEEVINNNLRHLDIIIS